MFHCEISTATSTEGIIHPRIFLSVNVCCNLASVSAQMVLQAISMSVHQESQSSLHPA